MAEKYACASERADESERALEELGGHLSEYVLYYRNVAPAQLFSLLFRSKLRMLELAEELLPLSDAHWAKDSEVTQCTACTEKFSISKRKHHCRLVRVAKKICLRIAQEPGFFLVAGALAFTGHENVRMKVYFCLMQRQF